MVVVTVVAMDIHGPYFTFEKQIGHSFSFEIGLYDTQRFRFSSALRRDSSLCSKAASVRFP